MSSEVAIRVQDVSKVYRIYAKPEDRLVQMATLGRVRRFSEFNALQNVSLEVRRGETVGIVGRNGCGKSTLLQIIVGTLQPTTGSLSVNGRIAALLELGAGFNGEFTGRENVYMNGAILGFSREEMDARFDQIAEFAAIGDFIERPVKTYSSGMFVRLAFAVATAVEPDILIVDEALSVGDEAFQRKCFARIEAIKERGGTILFVSHGAQTIVQLCDRAVLLDGGVKLLEGDPKLVVGQYQRLINASNEGAVTIKADIRAMGGIARAAPSEEITEPTPSAGIVEPSTAGAALASDEEDDGLADYFDPNLKSESTVHLEERGARISDVHITTLAGKPVNVLRVGKRYVFAYRVSFLDEARDVGFGFLVKMINGFEVAGIHSRNQLQSNIAVATRGSEWQIRIEFKNIFLPGTYFTNCGLGGTLDGDFTHLHRIIDACVFRVSEGDNIISQGICDLEGAIVREHIFI